MKSLDRNQLTAWRGASVLPPLVLYGAGDLGKLALHVLRLAGVEVTAFCDASALKQGNSYREIPIIAPTVLANFARDSRIIVSNNYISTVLPLLNELGFTDIYDCTSLFEGADFSDAELDVHSLEIQRKIAWHQRECAKHLAGHDQLILKYIDLVITEACSMKCVDCSNLMQYYENPQHSDLGQLFASVDCIMSAVDWIDELRVLGGEPFINKNLAAILEKIKSYKNFGHIIVYTNGTITPQSTTLKALQDSRVTVNITNYGKLSRRLPEMVTALEAAGVAHLVKIPSWTDSGRINFRHRSAEQLDTMFANCCVNDILTLLNGKLYRCPFSANATNLGAVPPNSVDMVNVCGDASRDQVRKDLMKLYLRDSHLQACAYCNGRDYSTPKIEAAIQVMRPLKVPPPCNTAV